MDSIFAIVNQETEKHPEDVDAAVDAAYARVKRLKDFKGYQESLIRTALREYIHGRRHDLNVQMRRVSGDYGGQAKVTAGEAVSRVAVSVYSYMIAGATLGSLKGQDLLSVAESEAATAEGHQFNAKLCKKLQSLVTADKTVRQCVSAVKLKKIFKELS